MPEVLLPPPLTRSIEVPSAKRTRAREGVPPKAFLYVTVNLKVVAGVPPAGEIVPLVRDTLPHVAESPRTGATNTNRDAATQTVSARAPPSLTRVLLAP
jgi:hypothetical protein